uniref:Secreted protein n=1 Tax=Aegilops tauschii subsp. strangulata TaxID=200361 RepID=A0A453BIG7_AEGTS
MYPRCRPCILLPLARWLLAREARMVHALVPRKPLQFFMAARRDGWLPTTPARSAQDCGGCALLMAASSSLVGRRERSWAATCGVVCGGFDG